MQCSWVCTSGGYFLPPLSTMPGDGKNEVPHVWHTRDERTRHKKFHMWRNRIVHEENEEVNTELMPRVDREFFRGTVQKV